MIKAGVGKSKELDSSKAGAQAAQAALKQAGLKYGDFVFVFSTIGHNQEELLKGVRSVTGNTPLIGCSAGGVITQLGPDEELKTVGVTVVSSDQIEFTPALAHGLRKDSFEAGRAIAEKLNKNWPKDPGVLILLPDGLSLNPDSLFRGLEENIKSAVPFVGGTSGETLAFKNTYQYFNEQVLQDSVPCVLLSGRFNFETVVSHGAVPAGIEKIVTKAEGNHIYEIDGKPAFEVFKEYLGDEITDLHGVVVSGVCLGVENPQEIKEKYEEVVLRIPLRLDKNDNSLYMAAEWPQGTRILICERNPERVLRRVTEASEEIKSKLGRSEPKLVIQSNCLGRGKDIMGAEIAASEIEASQQALGKSIPWLGWYSFGEIAPIGKKNYFHNWTDVLLVIY